MKRIRHSGGAKNRNRMRSQVIVQRLRKPKGVPVPCEVTVRDLAKRMHSGIRSAGPVNANARGIKFPDGVFDNLLDGQLAALVLPSGEWLAEILDLEGKSWHFHER